MKREGRGEKGKEKQKAKERGGNGEEKVAKRRRERNEDIKPKRQRVDYKIRVYRRKGRMMGEETRTTHISHTNVVDGRRGNTISFSPREQCFVRRRCSYLFGDTGRHYLHFKEQDYSIALAYGLYKY